MFSKKDRYFMSVALELAKQGNPSPNPYVGAVLVKNNQILGKGFHKRAGLPHAEVEAINSVKDKSKIRGSTLYVTLEPCSHYGRTPPCTNTILKYKIKRVVCSVEDPTKKIKGIEILRKKGIKAEVGLLEKESRELNEIFFHYSKTNLPFIAIKVALSKDKKIGFIGKRTKITGSKADEVVHQLRSKYDAILVGIHTILVDNPQLTSRIDQGRDPKRIILDPHLKIPINAKVLSNANVTIVTLASADQSKKKKLERKGISLITFNKKINLLSLLKTLRKQGITSILVEGGAKTHKKFIQSKLVNKFYLFISPKILRNKNTLPLFDGLKPKLKIKEKIRLGRDTLFVAN